MDRNGPASVFLRLLRTLLHTRPPEVNELSQQLSLGYKLGKTQARDGIALSGLSKRTWKIRSALCRSDKGLEMEPGLSA